MKNKFLSAIALGLFFISFNALAATPDLGAAEKPTKQDFDNYYQYMYLSTSTGMGAVMNQSQFEGVSYDEYAKKIREVLNATTGKMTVALDMEITARISACHKSGTILSEEDFNKLKAPYDVTPMEYTAYHLRLWEMIMTDPEYNGVYPLAEQYEKRVKELKDNGCNFDTVPADTPKEGCYDDDGDNPDRFGVVYVYDKVKQGKCHPCKYEDECVGNSVREKICKKDEKDCLYGCWNDVMHKCKFGCFAGRCLTEDESKKQLCDGQCLESCPAGTMDFGEGGCPQPKDFTSVKCCKKIFTTSTPPVGTCSGLCAKSSECPEGYEKKDNTSCAQIETKYKCGLFNWFDCYNYVTPTCCVPKEGTVSPPAPEQCAGECSMGDKCGAKMINKGPSGCESYQKCKPCGFLGLKKCCEYVPTTCCENPKPVTNCAKGVCTYEGCPAGMEDVGAANCGKKHKCHTCYAVAKCCDDVQARCCMATGEASCAGGKCQKESTCPAGYKNVGPADCGPYNRKVDCGLFSKCDRPAAMTCCMPEK